MSNSNEPVTTHPHPSMSTEDSSVSKPSDQSIILNNDCLYTIFGYLNIESLCHTANVSKQFRGVAEQVFHRYHRNVHFNSITTNESWLRRIFCKFGYLVTSLNIYFADRSSNFDTSAIAEYCSFRLERLILHRVRFSCDDIVLFIPRLKQLEIHDCIYYTHAESFADWNTVFTFRNCSKLEVLAFNMENESCEFLVLKFAKLKKLQLHCKHVNNRILDDILGVNKQLKHLDIMTCTNDELIYSIIQAKDLVELKIGGLEKRNSMDNRSEKGLLRLSKLKKLKLLQLDMRSFEYDQSFVPLMNSFVNENIPLEKLSVDAYFLGSADIYSLIQLKTLRCIDMGGVGQITDADVLVLLSRLPSLSMLKLRFKGLNTVTVGGIGLQGMLEPGNQLEYLKLVGDCHFNVTLEQYESLLRGIQISGRKKVIIDVENNKRVDCKVPKLTLVANEEYLEFKFDPRYGYEYAY